MNEMIEIWKEIPDLPGSEASSKGMAYHTILPYTLFILFRFHCVNSLSKSLHFICSFLDFQILNKYVYAYQIVNH